MDLTREQALKLHREMWGDMQKELGNRPSQEERTEFKISWCSAHFPTQNIDAHCFLCEYIAQNGFDCNNCPIDWSKGRVGYPNTCLTWNSDSDYRFAPISEILELPERKVEE